MPRTRIVSRQAKREKADQEEKVRLTQIKIDAVLEQVDELEKRAKNQVYTQIKLIHARTDNHLLEMKMSESLNLKLKYFTDYKWKVPEPPTSRARSSSISTARGRSRTPQTSLLPRSLTQSMDRGNFNRGRTPQKVPPMPFLRFPRAGELVLSSGGSPLAVQTDRREDCSDVHIPTKKGVFIVKPLKMKQVNREVLMQLDANVLNQVKTLQSNLEVIVDMATKMGKM